MWNEDDDEDIEATDKFDECFECINRFKFATCRECSVGEYFEQEDPDDLEDMIVR